MRWSPKDPGSKLLERPDLILSLGALIFAGVALGSSHQIGRSFKNGLDRQRPVSRPTRRVEAWRLELLWMLEVGCWIFISDHILKAEMGHRFFCRQTTRECLEPLFCLPR